MRMAWIIGAAVIGVRLACGGALAQSVAEPQTADPIALHSIAPDQSFPHPIIPHSIVLHSIVPERSNEAAGATAGHPVHRRVAEHKRAAIRKREFVETPHARLPALPPDILSAQEHSVREIADRNGDKTFLMVDKALGRILLFEDGKPVFMGRALTGESTADLMPPNELGEKFDKLDALQYKVTPAGRFTVTRGYDAEYGGPLFDIKEIKGKDWGIAIHRVYLGIPSEHRAARLQSPRDDDKNITYGCINVAPDTIALLIRELPEKGATALYVLPRDEPHTAAYFVPHNS